MNGINIDLPAISIPWENSSTPSRNPGKEQFETLSLLDSCSLACALSPVCLVSFERSVSLSRGDDCVSCD